MSDFTLTIFGATGYTGRLCVEQAVREGIAVRVAGRRRDALDALAVEHAGAGVPVTVAVADVTDRDAVAELADTSDVLLPTVGPYSQYGQVPVEAAINAGRPYLDVSGELNFITWVHQQAGRARDAGARLAPAVGYDGVPGDLLATVAARALDRPVHSARVAYTVANGKVSAGTARSALGALSRGGAAWRNGRVAQEPAGAEQWRVPFPDPPGSTTAVSVPFPEVASLGRSIGVQNARAYFVVPAGGVFSSVAGPAQRLATLVSDTPAWGLLERAVDRLPEGPAPEQRRQAKTVVLAEVAAADGVSAVRWARVEDPYGTTAVIAVAAARRLADGAGEPGVLTPTQLFDPPELLGQIASEVGPA